MDLSYRVKLAAKAYDEWPESFKEAFRLSLVVDRVPPALQDGLALLEEIDRLTAALAESNRLVKHWRDQHANEVKRARVLKDNLDMPLERIRAYCHMGELQREVDKMTAKIDSDNTIMGELRRGGCAFVELPAYWRGVESEVDKLKGELAAEREKTKGYKLTETVTISGSDADGCYHIPGVRGGGYVTLCGWVDVPCEDHDAEKHPVTCEACKKIVAYSKKLKLT